MPRGGVDWLVAAEVTHNDAGLRSFENPQQHGQPSTYLGNGWYAAANDFGGVHINGGVQNHWFYLLSQGGSGTNEYGYDYSVTGIGIEKAAQIAYRNLTYYLSPASQYIHAREGSIQAAIDLYGETSNEVLQVTNAWCAVGVGNCSQNGEYIALITPNGGGSYTAGNSESITWMSAGDIPFVNIDYSVSGGVNWIPVADNVPNTNSYLWSIPNVSTGLARVRVSATHSPSIFQTSQNNFTIHACDIQASFDIPQEGICEGNVFTFENTSIGEPSSQTWSINGNVVSFGVNHTQLFNNAGEYSIALTVSKGACSHTHQVSLQVFPQPDASFTYETDVNNPESGFVTFSPTVINAGYGYYWDFGDGTHSELAQPQRTYASGGYYDICLTVQNDCASQTNCQNLELFPERFAFQNAYEGVSSLNGAKLVASETGGFTIIGQMSDANNEQDMALIKTDGAGVPQWTKKIIGDDKVRHVKHALRLSDGGYAIAGKIYDGIASNFNAFLLKTDEQGNVLWEQYYGNQQGDAVVKVAQFPDGSMLMLANVKGYGSGNNDIMLLKLDESGNQIWAKTYGASNDDIAADFVVSPNGEIVVTGSTQSGFFGNNLLVMKVQAGGDLAWVKSIGSIHNELGTGVMPTLQNDGYYVTCLLQENGNALGKSLLLKLDLLGNKLWAKSYEQSGKSLAVNALTQLNDDMLALLANVNDGGNSSVHLIVCDLEGSSLNTIYGSGGTQYAFDMVSNADHAAVTILGSFNDVASSLSSSGGGDDGELFLVHEPINEYAMPNGGCGLHITQTLSNDYAAISESVPGGFVSADVQPAQMLFTDLMSLALPPVNAVNLCCVLPDADFEAVSVLGKTIGLQPMLVDTTATYAWHFGELDSLGQPISVKTFEGEPTYVTHTYSAAGVYHLCLTVSNACGSRSYCKDVSVTGSHVFQKTYEEMGNVAQGGIIALPAGNFVSAGNAIEDGQNSHIRLMNLNESGIPLWVKTYPAPNGGTENAKGLSLDNDGGFLIVGESIANDNSRNFILLKTDTYGNLQWRKSWDAGADEIGNAVITLPNGAYVLAGIRGNGAEMNVFCLKMNANGSVLWSREYGGEQFEAILDMAATSDGGFLLAGNAENDMHDFGDAMLMKIDANGDLEWTKIYGDGNWSGIVDIAELGNGEFALTGTLMENGNNAIFVCKINENGLPLWSNTYSNAFQKRCSSISPDGDGGLLISGATYGFSEEGNWDLLRIKTDSLGNMLHAFAQNFSQRDNALKAFSLAQAGYVAFADLKTSPSEGGRLCMIKTDELGAAICNEQSVVFQINASNVPVAPLVSSNVENDMELAESNGVAEQYCGGMPHTSLCEENLCTQVYFDADKPSVCLGDSVAFFNQSGEQNGIAFTWHVNGLPLSNAVDFTYVFSQSGYHQIVLTADNGNCEEGYALTIYVDGDCVWPGDFNRDGLVNHRDILEFGLAYGETGMVRFNASKNWLPQAVEPWGRLRCRR